MLIDVRDAQEFQEEHIEGAVHVPLLGMLYGTLGVLAETDKDTALFLYCRSGGRAERAKTLLLDQGFTRVTNLGGLEEAREAVRTHQF